MDPKSLLPSRKELTKLVYLRDAPIQGILDVAPEEGRSPQGPGEDEPRSGPGPWLTAPAITEAYSKERPEALKGITNLKIQEKNRQAQVQQAPAALGLFSPEAIAVIAWDLGFARCLQGHLLFHSGNILGTIEQRLKYVVELLSDGKHTVFSKKCGIPPGSFQAYINGQRVPPTEHLIKRVTFYGINLNWLLIGEGDPFIGGKSQGDKAIPGVEAEAIDPVAQLLTEEEARAGITLTPEQRTAILKILRELVEQDVRSIRELLRSIQGGKKKKRDE